MKSSEPPKNFKNQPRPLVKLSSVNFCQNFWNLSHETAPLSFYCVGPGCWLKAWERSLTLPASSCSSCGSCYSPATTSTQSPTKGFRYLFVTQIISLSAVLQIWMRIRSIESVCFWASRILLSSSKNSKKNLNSYCFGTSLRLFIFEKQCKCCFKKYVISKKT